MFLSSKRLGGGVNQASEKSGGWFHPLHHNLLVRECDLFGKIKQNFLLHQFIHRKKLLNRLYMFYFERNVLTTMLFSEYIRLLHRRLPLVQLSYQENVTCFAFSRRRLRHVFWANVKMGWNFKYYLREELFSGVGRVLVDRRPEADGLRAEIPLDGGVGGDKEIATPCAALIAIIRFW